MQHPLKRTAQYCGRKAIGADLLLRRGEDPVCGGIYCFIGTSPFASLLPTISRRRRERLGFPLALPLPFEEQQFMKARVLWDSFHCSGLAVFVEKLVPSCSLSSTGRKARPFCSLLRSSGYGGNVSPVLVPFPL